VGTLAKDRATLANARALAARYRKLFEEGIASKEDLDQYNTSADTQTGLVAADEAAVENARVQLSYATIHSPISGMTGNLLVYEGKPRQGDRPDDARHDHADEADLRDVRRPRGRARQGEPRARCGEVRVEAALPSDEAHPVAGVLSFVDNAVDATTGTIRSRRRSTTPTGGSGPGSS